MPIPNKNPHLLTQLADAMELYSRGIAKEEDLRLLQSVGTITRDKWFRAWTLVAPIKQLAAKLGGHVRETDVEWACIQRGIPVSSHKEFGQVAEINDITRGPKKE